MKLSCHSLLSVESIVNHFYQGTVIRTGITCKKVPCYMHDPAYRWYIARKAKIFSSYVKHC